jgi:hypothetical protein
MTRINAFIPPAELSDKHLLAEHREIKRIPNCISKGRYNLKDTPEYFKLEKGHVKFFYRKIKWLYKRYLSLHKECLKRGFDVEDYSQAFLNLKWIAPNRKGEYFWNNWRPDDFEIIRIQGLIRQRITDNKLKSKKTKLPVSTNLNLRYSNIKNTMAKSKPGAKISKEFPESSNIEKIVYYTKTNKLYTTFNNGSTYIYSEVTKEEVDQLINAESIGKMHLHLIVKSSKPFTKVNK